MFRALPGLGVLDFDHAAHPHAQAYDFCDVLVIGAGPSGLSAALAAAGQGATVVVVDENARAGGSGSYQLGNDTARRASCRAAAEAPPMPRIRVLTATYAAGYYADHWIPLVERRRMTKMRAGSDRRQRCVRTARRVPQQRPARRHAGLGRSA
jgi:sarcosine oxidase subunit alpha